jgi:predicted porin
MKKTLIALAVLAASGTAFAQSSVTIYGKLDQGLTRAIGADKFSVGQAAGSRFGVRGTEDLGGGLKANFNIENRFTPDDGVAASTFWGGRSIVGLQGGFGRVDIGRDYTAAFYSANGADIFGWDGVAANTSATTAGTNAIRFANGVFYTSPTMGGLTARVSYSQKEGATTATNVKNGSSIQLAYANGPLSASVGSETTVANNKFSIVAAAYDLGAAKLNVASTKGETAAGVESTGMIVGAAVPMGALTLKLTYATLEVGGVDTVQQLGLGARYALSKRTDLYTSYANNSKSTAAKKNGIEFGVHHNF